MAATADEEEAEDSAGSLPPRSECGLSNDEVTMVATAEASSANSDELKAAGRGAQSAPSTSALRREPPPSTCPWCVGDGEMVSALPPS